MNNHGNYYHLIYQPSAEERCGPAHNGGPSHKQQEPQAGFWDWLREAPPHCRLVSPVTQPLYCTVVAAALG